MGYVNLVLINMMIPTFIIAAVCTTKRGLQKFETVALPITVVLSLIHIIILIMIQIYIFNVEKKIKDGILFENNRMAKFI